MNRHLLILLAVLGLGIQPASALMLPPSRHSVPEPTMLFPTAAMLREPLSGAKDWALTGDALFGNVVLHGVDLTDYLWQWPGSPILPSALRDVPETAKVYIRTRAGGVIELSLRDLREHGALLTYAEGGKRAWTRLPEGKVNPRALYLAWKNPPARPEWLGVWDVVRITVVP